MLLKGKGDIGKRFYFFIMGLLLNGLAVSIFFKPYNIVTGGATGFSMILNEYIPIDLSLIILLVSSITLVLSFMVYGVEYGAKNILGTILLPVFIRFATLFTKFIEFEDISLFLLVLAGSVLSGFGFGLIKKSGYSLGGFYFLYDLMHDKFKISIAQANFIFNMFIIIGGGFVYGITECVYAFMALYISSAVADKVILGISTNKAFYIITKYPKEVKDYIVDNLKTTVTFVDSKGGYSNNKGKLLICVVPTVKYNYVKDFVREIDKDAFFLITDSYYVSK